MARDCSAQTALSRPTHSPSWLSGSVCLKWPALPSQFATLLAAGMTIRSISTQTGTVAVERVDGGKLRCTGATWSDAVVIFPGEVLAFQNIERQTHVLRAPALGTVVESSSRAHRRGKPRARWARDDAVRAPPDEGARGRGLAKFTSRPPRPLRRRPPISASRRPRLAASPSFEGALICEAPMMPMTPATFGSWRSSVWMTRSRRIS
jgi:hypothetical protein